MAKANSDIGINPGDADYLEAQYPRISEVLIWPELVEHFRKHERVAVAKKNSSRWNIVIAIVFMVASLGVTLFSASQISEVWLTPNGQIENALPIISATLLGLSLILGKGILFGGKRDDWLRHRIAAERLRHLYFQYLISNLQGVCSRGRVGIRETIEGRDNELSRVMNKVSDPVYIQSLRVDNSLEEACLLATPSATSIQIDLSDKKIDPKKLAEFRRFYQEFRFEWQKRYTAEQMVRKTTPLPLTGSLADQEHSISNVEFAATVLIVVFQIVAVCSNFLFSDSDKLVSVSTLVASILAVCVVGAQAFRDGKGLTEDLSRNRVYDSYITKLLKDYLIAVADNNHWLELRIINEMEHLAYFETREFLLTHSSAKFSI